MRMAVAAKAIETKASFGHTRSIEVCVGVAGSNRMNHDWPAWLSTIFHRRSTESIFSALCSYVVTPVILPAPSTPPPAATIE
ncbi:hypothetical protein [Agrobacterium tumefaciens]|uniref:hypothetical protein n=1 Tax=Agrobacterium tumefaciens TaxID=358 RepID=UPI001574685C|nr:hypothetical protein [Agrobacterium tumefaciens]